MSVQYKPVGWVKTKLLYDAVLIVGIAAYLFAFLRLAPASRPAETALDEQSLAIKAYGSCAFILLTLILAIGPLTRLDQRFLPLLYNRRHFGVMTCAVAAAHVTAVFGWYFAYSPLDPWVALFATDTSFGALRGFPYLPFGIGAFSILLVLAATSHDFWLNFLTPPLWKAIHMSIYGAYLLAVAHVTFGALQDVQSFGLAAIVSGSCAVLITLHLASALKERRFDRDHAKAADAQFWIDAGPVNTISRGRGRVVLIVGGPAIALFRDGSRIHALSNLCAHQNGPLGEGRIINGCVVCPWHGYEFRLNDGCSPPPYTERVTTFPLKLVNGHVLIDTRPHPLGVVAEPLLIDAEMA